jgi:hypothetical protein
VPVPRVGAIREVKRDGWWLLPVVDRFGPLGGLVEVPDELYLRQFRDTPADDLDALIELCKLGLIRPLSTAEPYGDLPIRTDEQWERLLADVGQGLWPGQWRWYGKEAERHEVWERHRGTTLPVHAAEVALRVRAMQRTTNHLLAYLAGESVAPAWRDCANDDQAWSNFIRWTGAALRDFHVRIDVEVIGQPPRPEDLQLHEVYTSTYSAGMLQLVNDLATGETVRTCANERCRHSFVRQLGRSAYGGHRKRSVLYCSNTCARAQYQREKRRRDRAAGQGRREIG